MILNEYENSSDITVLRFDIPILKPLRVRQQDENKDEFEIEGDISVMQEFLINQIIQNRDSVLYLNSMYMNSCSGCLADIASETEQFIFMKKRLPSDPDAYYVPSIEYKL